MADIDAKSDWDVDDDGNGLSDQRYVPDPAATGGNPAGANEADNVDESPGTTTRVDANGNLRPSEARGRGVPPHDDGVKEQNRGSAGKERRRSGGKGAPKEPREPLDGVGGVQPEDYFIVEFDLTGAPKGDECVFVLVPSTVGGRKVALLDEGVTPGLAPGQEYAAATPDSSPARAFTGFEVAFTPGFSFGSIGTKHETNFGVKANGKNIQYDAFNLHGDVRYYYGVSDSTGWFRPSLIVG